MDFQDSGVDTGVLEELKQVWQEKLSAFKVAQFPWDPDPVSEPAPKPEEAETGDVAADGKRIKPDPEADLPPPMPQVPLGQPLSDPSLAAARAQQMVEKKLGSAAQQQQQRSFGLMLPTPPQQHLSGQTDGPDDGPVSRYAADEQIRQIVLEGEEIRTQEDALGEAIRRFNIQSDIMQERPLNKKRRKAKSSNSEAAGGIPSTASPVAGPSSSTVPKMLQTDGPELDEDAINSDLDDPDEEQVDDDDDGEGIPQIMLCMYDKVQRTKNKWKCVLKHGVLTINGKEYVFQKATGEYEW
ncbi:hypothetical protein ABW20_dc0108204 [Dactylellina cionopaga]|nr:hypothetical protein ABW20_dc0108204 [Dactylellina cionopaga]